MIMNLSYLGSQIPSLSMNGFFAICYCFKLVLDRSSSILINITHFVPNLVEHLKWHNY